MTQAQKDGQKRYFNKIKSNPEFQEARRGYSKKYYDNNKQTVIERVRRYQAKFQDLEQLERLYYRRFCVVIRPLQVILSSFPVIN